MCIGGCADYQICSDCYRAEGSAEHRERHKFDNKKNRNESFGGHELINKFCKNQRIIAGLLILLNMIIRYRFIARSTETPTAALGALAVRMWRVLE